jgi:predicted dehydrogenase
LKDELNIGVVGAGSFSAFAINAFLKIKGVRIVAITDIKKKNAVQLSKTCNAIVSKDITALLQNENIDLIYIATPPFLHYEQSKMALLSGKNVICEKPAALRTSEAEELSLLASSRQLLYVVNLMQCYNPLYDMVTKIIKEKVLGNFLHGFFENYASDENLNANHWFWDEAKSGGIFIEHGVHFFDMFSGWLGKGKTINAIQLHRPKSVNIIDRVQATVLYKDGTVNFYHGFDQPKILDRQEMRLLFEHGEITLYEWIPVKMKLHGLMTDQQFQYLKELTGESKIVYNGEVQTKNKKVTGRFTEIIFDKEITLEFSNAVNKEKTYELLLINMLTDQWNWIKDHSHKRKIDDSNAVISLCVAEEATKISKEFNPI